MIDTPGSPHTSPSCLRKGGGRGALLAKHPGQNTPWTPRPSGSCFGGYCFYLFRHALAISSVWLMNMPVEVFFSRNVTRLKGNPRASSHSLLSLVRHPMPCPSSAPVSRYEVRGCVL